MIALSPFLSWAIVLFLVAFFIWLYAWMKTSKRADRMSQRWVEKQWLADQRGIGNIDVSRCSEQPDCPAPVFHHLSTCASGMGPRVIERPRLALYDQSEEQRRGDG